MLDLISHHKESQQKCQKVTLWGEVFPLIFFLLFSPKTVFSDNQPSEQKINKKHWRKKYNPCCSVFEIKSQRGGTLICDAKNKFLEYDEFGKV